MSKMNLIFLVVFIFISFECVSLQQQQKPNAEDQIRELQAQVKKQRQFLKEVGKYYLSNLHNFIYLYITYFWSSAVLQIRAIIERFIFIQKMREE